ncbi:T9SS type A sorting domain-containing protein [bacterium]|nr:T9SS type A sorting domain-containing protein [bacterium]
MLGNSIQRMTLIALACLLSLTTLALAESIHYSDSWAAQGLTILNETASGLELVFSLKDWQLEETSITGEAARKIILPGAFLPNDAGAPDLPGQGFFIALPNGARAQLEILEIRSETSNNINLVPAFRLPREDEDGPLDFSKDMDIWSLDAVYPAEPVKISEGTTLRGVDAVMLGVTPFQYNPVSRELTVIRDIRFNISFEDGEGHFGRDRYRSRHWDPILRSTFLNSASLPEVDFNLANAGARTLDYEYLIICPDDPSFHAWADSLRVFRCEQGIRAGVVTCADVGGNTISAIESFINDAYDNWDVPPSAFMLLGDYGSTSTSVVSPIWNSYCVSDNIFADVNGDNLPDIAHARLCVRDETELAHLVSKAIEYERNPPTNQGFYDNPVIAGGWQTERWFILCDEVLFGFLANEHGKTPVREYAIYDGTPGTSWSTATNTSTVVNYFGPNGLGYLPATPGHLNDWGGNATRLNADINAGSFIVQHRDHGYESGWGEPSYSTSNLSGLSNEDLTFVFSINCLTGKYNWSSECFTEAFHRHAQGALGLIAASEISYSFVNDTYVWGMFDYFWPDFDPGYGVTGPHNLLPAFANAYGKIYLQASSWPYNTGDKVITHHLFHHHGDAYTSVYSEMPEDLTVSHDNVLLVGLDYFSVSADAGALIGVSRDGEYLGSAMATGFPVNVALPSQIPGSNVVVTVTQQNHYRYRMEIPVVPPDGPYLIYADATVLDPDGDDDGMLDEAESAGIELSLENVGIEITTGISVEISTDDSYLSILEGTRAFPDIPSGGFGSNLDPFMVEVAGNVPDEHSILIDFTATSSESSWDGSFQLTAQAPVLETRGIEVIDLPFGDGSGTADAGETITLRVKVGNVGHSDAHDLAATLSTMDMNATVLDGNADCEYLPQGGESTIHAFEIEINPLCPEPKTIGFRLHLGNDSGFSSFLDLFLPVGGWFDDIESDRGWTVGAQGDDASTGIWTRVDPNGTIYETVQVQPEDDHSAVPGVTCFITGQGSVGGTAGEADVDGGKTTLLSPVFDLAGATEANISYWRWYTNDEGNNPAEDYWDVEVTADGLQWVSLEHDNNSLEEWVQKSFALQLFIPLTGQVQIRFVASDETNPSLVEAGVDDFLLTAFIPIATDAEELLPARLALGANFPNPFNPKTTLRFDMPSRAEVELAIYDVTGRRVNTLIKGVMDGGHHEVIWEGRDAKGKPVASGIYFSRLSSEGQLLTRKMLLLK